MNEEGVRRRKGGRSARVRQAVLGATLEVLVEHGPDAVSIGGVARRAGVHETSIYRRWGTREHVIVDALLAHSEERLPVPDTGSLREDLVAFARSVTAYLDSPLGGTLVRAMAAVDDDPALAASRAQFWRTRFESARVMVDRAVARGELPQGVDPATLLELLVAPLHFRALLTRRPADERTVGQIVDVLVPGAAGGSAGAP